MHRKTASGIAALALLLVIGGLAGLAMQPAPSEARTYAQSGGINSSQLRFCENQRNDRWVTRHAPNDQTFFHQEIGLGEGNYTLNIRPNGRFRFNAFVYDAETRRYLGGARNVGAYTHRFRAGPYDGQFLVQLVKTTRGCTGCTVTMSLNAYNCPRQPRGNSRAPLCPPNSCYDSGLLGTSGCVRRPGANGGVCGTPGN
ncbi:MAG: hypothetical protein ACTS1Z_14510 [Parasphingopyxis sp.]|uniref:hypothetical protein n=1 Tax=Parasphingopyxis sp. TaxID=1920299 RepID=UPI003FA18D25